MVPLILGFVSVASVTALFFAGQLKSSIRRRGNGNPKTDPRTDSHATSSAEKSVESPQEKAEGRDEQKEVDDVELEDLRALKHLYYQLHNLESFPEVLPQARKLLLYLLRETTAAAHAAPAAENILDLGAFSRQALEQFQHRLNTTIGNEWQEYNARRKAGGPRELFADREEAIGWLKQLAPVKYVDGAWLGHIGKVTAPFGLQKTMKGAWQILSEELGDGDLEKNHVHVFHALLGSVAPGFPNAGERDFGHARHQLNELSVWKAAVAQLLISLFPHDFLPEILGFNLHFEAVSMDTLKAGKELKEVGLDPYYFILHISIDNADSGHTAIAMEVVCEYMDYVRTCEGEQAAHAAWAKVQAGYLLSQGLPGTAVSPSRRRAQEVGEVLLTPIEVQVVRIFKAKAQVVHGIHCSSTVRIGSRSVAEWLDPVALESPGWQRALLRALGRSKYWIRRGDSRNSRFLRELQWNGRMFGSFTQHEFDVLRQWVESLASISSVLEARGTHAEAEENDVLSGYPAGPRYPRPGAGQMPAGSAIDVFPFRRLPALALGPRPVFETFLPAWLSHPCLLQGFVAVPFRTKNQVACRIVKVLRAQGGFDIEQECVGGMCEVRRPHRLGLAGIGMNMMAQHRSALAALPSLKHILQEWPSELAVYMLHLSLRPVEHRGRLIGMATAFAKMHARVAAAPGPLLSGPDQATLRAIAQRELDGLAFCWQELESESDGTAFAACCHGYLVAAHEIQKCFRA